MRLLLTLLATTWLTGCATVASRPCPRVTEFPAGLMAQAADELTAAPALRQMMQAMQADRAFNRAVCPR
jgi:hypothetical protein